MTYEEIKKKTRENFRKLDIPRMDMPQTWDRLMTIMEMNMAISCEPKEYAEEHFRIMSKQMEWLEGMPEIAIEYKLMRLALRIDCGRDFLGEIYADLKINKEPTQVNLTKDTINLLAKVMYTRITEELKTNAYAIVRDIDIGSGALLLRLIKYLQHGGVNYMNRVFFIGQSENAVMAKMAYTQLSSLNCSGYIVTGAGELSGNPFDPNIAEGQRIMYMPFYHLKQWKYRDPEEKLRIS